METIDLNKIRIKKINELRSSSGQSISKESKPQLQSQSVVTQRLVSWLGLGEKSKDPENLSTIISPSDIASSLKRAAELNRLDHTLSVLEVFLQHSELNGIEYITSCGTVGCCIYLDQLLDLRLSSVVSVEICLRAIATMSSQPQNRCRFLSIGSHYRVLRAMQLHSKDQSSIEWGLVCLRFLSEDDGAIENILTANGCEVVVQVLGAFKDDEIVVEFACRTIYNLTHDDDRSQAILAENGVCELLVISLLMERYRTFSSTSIEWIFRAIGGVSRRSDHNKEVLANNGACEIVLQVSNLYLVGEDNSALAESACWAIGNLAFPDTHNQDRLRSGGACEYVLTVLEKYSSCGRFVQEAFRAIRNLSCLNNDSLDFFVEKGACALVLRAIRSHLEVSIVDSIAPPLVGAGILSGFAGIKLVGSASGAPQSQNEEALVIRGTVQWGWYCVAGLAECERSIPIFYECGVVEILKTTFNRFGQFSDVMQWACHALSKLGHNVLISSEFSANFMGKLVEVINSHIQDADVVEEVLVAIGTFSEDEANYSNFVDSDICNILNKVFSRHSRCEEIAEQISFVISQLCQTELDRCCENVANSGIFRTLSTILSTYPENPAIAMNSFNSFWVMAGWDKHAAKLGSFGVTTAIVNSLALHLEEYDIVIKGLSLIQRLIENESNLARLKSDKLCNVIVRAMMLNKENQNEITASCLSVIVELANDDIFRSQFASESTAEAVISSLLRNPTDKYLALIGCAALTALCGGMVGVGLEGSSVDSSGKSLNKRRTFLGDLKNSIRTKATSDSSQSLCEQLGMAGGCVVVSNVLRNHLEFQDNAISGCLAVNSLAAFSANRVALCKAGCCDLVIEILLKYQNNGGLVAAACTAVGSLSKDVSCRERFGECNACQILANILTEFLDSTDVCSAASRALAYLCCDNGKNQLQLGADKALFGIVNSLKRHLQSEVATKNAVHAIAEASVSCPSNVELLSQTEICELLPSALREHMKSERLSEYCCRSIVALKPMNVKLGQFNACEAVLSVLNEHTGNEELSQWGCRALGSLAEVPENRIILGNNFACETVTSALQRHVGNETMLSVVLMRSTSSTSVALWGCDAMFFLAGGVEGSDFQQKLGAAGACEAVAKALTKYSEIETVACACFRAIIVLSRGNELHKSRLGGLGVCPNIVESLHMFPSSIEIALWGCRAVAILAQRHESNILKFGLAGACETIPVSMQAHQTSSEVASAGSEAIAAISEYSSQPFASRLGTAGACEALVSVLQKHRADCAVVERACQAIANLSKGQGNTSWFGATGCCEAILAVQKVHFDVQSLNAAAWLAVGNLCKDENNRVKFALGGACDSVIDCLKLHIQSKEVVWACSFAIEMLCEKNAEKMEFYLIDAINDVESSQEAVILSSRDRLFSNGVCECLVVALKMHNSSEAVVCNLCRAIAELSVGGQLTINRAIERDSFGKVDACAAVIHALSTLSSSESVSRWACLALATLGFCNGRNQAAIEQAGGCSLIVQVMRFHRHSSSGSFIVEAAARSLYNLCHENDFIRTACGRASACEALLEALDVHCKSYDVCFACCQALHNLLDDNSSNISTISFSGAAEILVGVAQRFNESNALLTAIFATFGCMCNDRVGRHKLALANAPKLIVAILQRLDKSEQTPVQLSQVQMNILSLLCCAVISALSHRNSDIQTKFGSFGVCKVIAQIVEKQLSTFYSGSSPTSSSTTFFGSFPQRNHRQAELLTSRFISGDSKELGRASEIYSPNYNRQWLANTNLCSEAIRAISSLALSHEANRARFMALPVADLLGRYLSDSSSHSGSIGNNTIQVLAAEAIEILAGRYDKSTSES